MKNGIDISQYQGNVDFTRLKTDFVIIRAGYGRVISQKDPRFEENYKGCRSAKIPCGAYWYSYAVTEEEARTEAAVCLDVIKGKKFEYPIYFDMEEARQTSLGREKCSAIAAAFLERLEKAGYFAGIYSSQYILENFISEEIRRRYTVWLANYTVSKPIFSGRFSMWQRSNTGTAAGISGNVDLDVCYEDFPAIIRGAGLNGYRKKKRSLTVSGLTVDGVTYAGTLNEI